MRARNVKPGFFKNETLAELHPLARILFAGLWCMADREGRMEYRPKRIKAEVLPYDNCNIEKLLITLHEADFLLLYEVDNCRYLQIKKFLKHQDPHYKEAPSLIPPPVGEENKFSHRNLSEKERQAIFDRDGRRCVKCGAEGALTIDYIIPRAKGGTSDFNNLQTLCRRCNGSKNNRSSINDKPIIELSSANDKPIIELSSANDKPIIGQSHSYQPPTRHPLIPDSGFLIPDSGFLIPDSKKAKRSGKKERPVDNSPAEPEPDLEPNLEPEPVGQAETPEKDDKLQPFFQNLKSVIKQLEPIYPSAYEQRQVTLFVEANIRNKNLDAIIHALTALIKAHEKGKPIQNLKRYLDVVVTQESQNYNAQEHQAEAEKHKAKPTPAGMMVIGQILSAIGAQKQNKAQVKS